MASQLTISAPCYEFAYILEIPHANMLKKLDMLKSIQCEHHQNKSNIFKSGQLVEYYLILLYLQSEDIYRLSLKTGQTICRPKLAALVNMVVAQPGQQHRQERRTM